MSSSDAASSSSASAPRMPPPAAAASAARRPGDITAEEEKADEYKETWLKMWTNTTNPDHISCRVAFDIICWCFGPVNQVRSIYRTGSPSLCQQQMEDFKLCLKVTAKGKKDHEEGRRMLREARAAREDPRPHIWKFRTEPPPQFRRPASEQTDAAAASK